MKSLDKIISHITDEGLISFLSSSLIKGIGKVFANKIITLTGKQIISPDFKLDEELSMIPGLGESKIIALKESLQSLKYPLPLYAFLFSAGLKETDVEKILSHYKGKTLDVILDDPYNMVEDVFKLSFFTADKVGKLLGISSDDPRRIKGALLTSIRIYAENGSMFATPAQAVATTSKILGISEDKISDEIDNLINEERVIKSHGGLYLPVYYKAEKESAQKLAEIVRNHQNYLTQFPIPTRDREGHLLNRQQISAIETVLHNPITVITGGPGTGKTTAIRGIVKLFDDYDKKSILLAPTGRAAKRLADMAGKEAMTIHRLLGYSKGKGYKIKKIDADILIIDEASMLEQVIFNHLLQSLDDKTKIVLVGDTDQLPAIGAGDVLNDFIKSGRVPVIFLNNNFRQQAGSLIAANANAIKNGSVPSEKENSDFMIIREDGQKKIHSRIMNMVSKELPSKYNILPKDIQVVSPQQEGPLGAKQLNLDIQNIVNPTGPALKHGQKIFRLDDRVMQTVNSSERNTFNGETGWISDVDEENLTLTVTFFDGKQVKYGKKDLKELSLAYATSVHKLQGSETDYMVMPLTMTHRSMLYRNLVYTGISRAKKMCVIIGEEKALRTAIDNHSPSERNSNFRFRLCENLPAIQNAVS